MDTTAITNGIEISVRTAYQEDHSSPSANRYVYAYFILIKNTGKDTVQLLRRHWFISDVGREVREVEGAGVIGQMPVLRPGEHFEYNSWTQMNTPVGKMYGFYTLTRRSDGVFFEATIPEFSLIAPFIHN